MPDSWPVAPIPTALAASHPTGRRVPVYWPRHGNLFVLIDGQDVFVSTIELHDMVDLSVVVSAQRVRPAATWRTNENAPLIDHYTLADTVRMLEASADPAAADCLAWLREVLPMMFGDDAIEASTDYESFVSSVTVQRAAAMLSRDPLVQIGRTRLFACMQQIGWVQRTPDDSAWEPTLYAVDEGLLVTRDVNVHAGARTTEYSQIHVTIAGLNSLRQELAPPV